MKENTQQFDDDTATRQARDFENGDFERVGDVEYFNPPKLHKGVSVGGPKA